MEHWLPLFHDRLETLFDYLPGAPVVLDPLAEDAARERLGQIADYYEARQQALAQKDAGAALPAAAAGPALSRRQPNGSERLDAGAGRAADAVRGARTAGADDRRRHARRAAISPPSAPSPARNVFDAVTAHVQALQAAGKRVVIALWSEGARERLSHVLADHGLRQSVAGRVLAGGARAAEAAGRRWRCWASNAASRPPTPPSSASRTFSATGWCGRAARRKRADNFIAEVDGAVGRRSRRPCRSRHRPLRRAARRSRRRARRTTASKLHYAGGDKLYLPVENIELLSRYGSEDSERRARQARRRRLAGAQGAAEAAHPRDGRRADQDRRRAAAARGADARLPRTGRLRRVLRPLPLRGDRRPADRDRRRARRSRPPAGRWTG